VARSGAPLPQWTQGLSRPTAPWVTPPRGVTGLPPCGGSQSPVGPKIGLTADSEPLFPRSPRRCLPPLLGSEEVPAAPSPLDDALLDRCGGDTLAPRGPRGTGVLAFLTAKGEGRPGPAGSLAPACGVVCLIWNLRVGPLLCGFYGVGAGWTHPFLSAVSRTPAPQGVGNELPARCRLWPLAPGGPGCHPRCGSWMRPGFRPKRGGGERRLCLFANTVCFYLKREPKPSVVALQHVCIKLPGRFSRRHTQGIIAPLWQSGPMRPPIVFA